MSQPLEEYARRVASGRITEDPAQRKAVAAFDRLYRALVDAKAEPRTWRRRIAAITGRKPVPIRGLYLWGSVGRGKTFLMDLFYGCLPFDDKIRRHFHRFMANVHTDLKRLRELENPLDTVADRLAARTRIICFDEFAVTDIADAMILGNLFTALFERGVTLAATSNTAPRLLYADGLQRQRFLPTIELIERHTEVLKIQGDLDYRLDFLEHADVYQYPAGAAADAHLAEYFAGIAPDQGEEHGQIDILGRVIDFERRADAVVWFDFASICDGPRSQNDYIELARCFQSVLVSNVPQFTGLLENQARRFIALVDEFYDRRVKLILSAQAPIENLYVGRRLGKEFQRTRSRLKEMQSHDYLAAAHRP
jgi:cell division protein ZapE